MGKRKVGLRDGGIEVLETKDFGGDADGGMELWVQVIYPYVIVAS